jgi:uncharacterized membrane protein required for colicin V production
MTLFDVILLVILGAFVLYGIWFGLVHAIGSLVGGIAATIVAGFVYSVIGDWLATIFGNPVLMKVLSFLIIFFIVSKLFGFLFYFLEKGFGLITRLPFIHSIDRLLGGIIGFFEGILVIGLIMFIITKYPLNPTLTNMIAGAKLVPWFINSSVLLQLLLPQSIKNMQSRINY